ncbi:MAG: HEAT repeat domain-containing protein [Propionibacteriales bacterium]|nr:HEAT repeat domain-containing protein [Propionibacteriales bacterium]
MTQDQIEIVVDRLKAALQEESASARLQTVMATGLRPHPRYIDVLVERFTVEPEFHVRDMLTWALIHHDHTLVLERVLPELDSPLPQARSQALHTLSKLKDQRAWPSITTEHLTDPEDQVALTAWRAAAALVPEDEASALAEVLSTQFGRGDRAMQRGLSRALAALGDAATPAIERAKKHQSSTVRAHALATEKMVKDPDVGFDVALAAARRTVAILGAPLVDHLES